MSDVEIEEDNRNALIGFHAFTRCEFTSHFVIFPRGEKNKLENNVKMSVTMVNQRQKIKKQKHWLKCPKAVRQKTKLGPKYN